MPTARPRRCGWRLRKPTAAATSSSPTTASTGSPPRPSRRGSPTSATSWRWNRGPRRLVHQPAPGDPDHPEAASGEVGVPAAIALEGIPGGVKGEAVDLDDEALGSPEEVDYVGAEADVAFGLR